MIKCSQEKRKKLKQNQKQVQKQGQRGPLKRQG